METKPTYKVNPAINPNAEIERACERTKYLLLEALSTIAPAYSRGGTINIDYNRWDTMNNVLLAIREKYNEWQGTDSHLRADEIIYEISTLLEKAGY